MQRFSAMWTDKLGEAIKSVCDKPYEIECHHHTDDFEAIDNAVSQGIDSHLEAIFFKQGMGGYGKIKLTFEPASVPILVRRLLESDNEHSNDLASCICETLGIELV